jgi:hypothetical protein
MKILRSKDWVLLGMVANSFVLGNKPAFLFQHRGYGDVLVLNEAKYIDVENDKVFFFDAESKNKIHVSKSDKDRHSESLVHDLRNRCVEIGI